jgi:hypothetical protein
MTVAATFSPGELVRARGREWIVLSSGDELRLRPLTGSEDEAETLIPELEPSPSTSPRSHRPAASGPVHVRPRSSCAMPSGSHCAAVPALSEAQAGSTSSRAPTSSPL